MLRFARLLQLAALGLLLTLTQAAAAAEKTSFKVAWSIYVGWMPWDYAQSSGILKKWADKYGIKIELTQINDYVESINQYTAGQFDACVMTNMDMLTIPAAGGVDSTALIIGDYSNGNDGIVKYTSAHVDYAESELIVRSFHSCQDKPETIEEVRRILHEHLKQAPVDLNAAQKK